uniref:tRNA-uridine aminocarboxypropyltransferase n=1 Tax=Kalanchoe fedtschenkoi TaxID=63787 RepID=A0A7N0TPG5_KALFE
MLNDTEDHQVLIAVAVVMIDDGKGSSESMFDCWVDGASSGRSICGKCNRPSSVCICSALPDTLIDTATKIIIVQHPHQLQNPLCTVPILTNTLRNATVIVARRLRLGVSPLLDSLYHTQSQSKAAYLFPPTKQSSSTPLSDLRNACPLPRFEVLIAFDGTWNHAREMVAASMEFLSAFSVRVCLECDERAEGKSMYESELILRKEPYQGCVSTAEAVARVLGVIEPGGMETESQLVHALGQMVKLQKGFLNKPAHRRPKLEKKNKKGKTENLH